VCWEGPERGWRRSPWPPARTPLPRSSGGLPPNRPARPPARARSHTPRTTPNRPHPLHPQVIDLGDDMELEVLPPGAEADALACSDPTIPCDGRNLVIKARGA
jgi:hypothetical protein